MGTTVPSNKSLQATRDGVPPKRDSAVMAWLRLAAQPATVRRALWTAVIVGFVLIAINDGPAILSGQVTRDRVVQMCLTVLVPYMVSTVSSVSTRRELAAKRGPDEQAARKGRGDEEDSPGKG